MELEYRLKNTDWKLVSCTGIGVSCERCAEKDGTCLLLRAPTAHCSATWEIVLDLTKIGGKGAKLLKSYEAEGKFEMLAIIPSFLGVYVDGKTIGSWEIKKGYYSWQHNEFTINQDLTPYKTLKLQIVQTNLSGIGNDHVASHKLVIEYKPLLKVICRFVDKTPAKGVTIRINGVPRGSTDDKGEFSLILPEDEYYVEAILGEQVFGRNVDLHVGDYTTSFEEFHKPEEVKYKLTVTVVDKATKATLDCANLTIGGISKHAAGGIAYFDLWPGTYVLVAMMEGYKTLTMSFTMPASDASLTIELEKPAVIPWAWIGIGAAVVVGVGVLAYAATRKK